MTDEDLRALQDQAHMLTELTRHPGWAVFVDYVQTVLMAPLSRRLLSGGLDDMSAYKKTSGEIVGLDRALGVPSVVNDMVLNELARRTELNESVT